MSLEEVQSAPTVESFRPLSEHQEQTPSSFFGGPPVLHLHAPKASVLVPKSQLEDAPLLKKLQGSEPDTERGEASDVVIQNVDVWVTSRNLTLYSQNGGVAITYPSIALHALGTHESSHLPDGASQVVFLQINLHDPDTINSDDDIQTLDLTIHVTEITQPQQEQATVGSEGHSPVKALFEALSACADLHPDPEEQGSGDEEEAPEPGAGGWITSENMHEYIDEDGNFIGTTSLGPGAGTTRTREEGDDDEKPNGTGDGETKWQRTD